MTALVEPFAVGAREVHLWTAALDVPAERRDALAQHLSDDERERAGRFRFPRDRDRFVTGRGLLRELLARLTGRPAAELVFVYGEHRRPCLAGGELAFNLAHTGGTAIYAVAADEPVGVDIERSGAAALADRVPEHFFSDLELADLRVLPNVEQEEAFLRCWTRKEAYVKGHGAGLSLPLRDFAVTLAPGAPAELVWTAWSSQEPARWRLHDVSDFCPGHVAAVAVGAHVDVAVHRESSNETLPRSAAGATQKEMT
jgi:4'-phosphopantetheinyl transferase